MGVAPLVRDRRPQLTEEEVRARVRSLIAAAAEPIPDTGCSNAESTIAIATEPRSSGDSDPISAGVPQPPPQHYLEPTVVQPPSTSTAHGSPVFGAWRKPIRLGTDFSGMDAPSIALQMLGIPFSHVFANDTAPAARSFIFHNHTVEHIYTDLALRPVHRHGTLDLYVAGPPCQPWSSAGLRHGTDDPKGRGHLFQGAVDFIVSARPRAFVLENVDRLATYQGGLFLGHILKDLRGGGYRVFHRILNTELHGLPQHRVRLYLVGFLDTVAGEDFDFPPACPTLSLEEILAPPRSTDDPARLPSHSAPAARHLVKVARDDLPPSLDGRDWVVNESLSEAWAGPARLIAPCLTHARLIGFWVGSRGRPLSLFEAARLQGILPECWRWPADSMGHALLGNTMSVCILQRLFARILTVLDPSHPVADPWEDGSARDAIRASAAKEGEAFLPGAGQRRGAIGWWLCRDQLPP